MMVRKMVVVRVLVIEESRMYISTSSQEPETKLVQTVSSHLHPFPNTEPPVLAKRHNVARRVSKRQHSSTVSLKKHHHLFDNYPHLDAVHASACE